MFTKSLTTFALLAALVPASVITMSTTKAEAAGGRNAAFAVGAITGLAVGAIATHASSHRHNGHYHRNYNGHTHHYGRPAPWTAAWYDYCSARYRSFNPRTGYFITYSGRARFCR
ncbi:MAG: BA14K family protein [Cohaesibacter sp.]|jgi:hypothetical protein|nr:BA14K family protein [Cohaesibacter sp.]